MPDTALFSSTLAVVQARMNSSRLPGKVLKPFSNGKTLLDYQIRSLSSILSRDKIVIATTRNPADDMIEERYGEQLRVHRGSEQDVLSRFTDIGESSKAEHIIRMPSDNPFTYPEGIHRMLKSHIKTHSDYTSYAIGKVPIMLTTVSFFAEVIRTQTLLDIAPLTTPQEKEHVTLAAYTRLKEQFKINFLDVEDSYPRLADPAIRLTVDTPQDFAMVDEILQRLDLEGPTDMAGLNKIISYLNQTGLLEKMARESAKPYNSKAYSNSTP